MFKPENIISISDVEKTESEVVERAWRDAELLAADVKVNILLDSGASGTGEWGLYRVTLRDYPETVDFPYGTRPTKPTSI